MYSLTTLQRKNRVPSYRQFVIRVMYRIAVVAESSSADNVERCSAHFIHKVGKPERDKCKGESYPTHIIAKPFHLWLPALSPGIGSS